MTTGAPTPVRVLGVGAAAPTLRLAAAEVARAWSSGGGRGRVAVCDADEDTLTLAWRAATDALGAAGVAVADVSGLWWGTTRPPLAEGPSHAFLAAALGLPPSIEGALVSGSPHCGMEALLAAWDALAAGHASIALVVASDALLPGLGTAGEVTTGAGAGAVVLGAPTGGGATSANGASAPARLTARATRALPVVDRYRADAGAATGDVYDGRLFREEVFIPLVGEVGAAVRDLPTVETPAADAGGSDARTDDDGAGGTVSAWALSDPDGKLASAVARRLGGELASAPVHSALGDTGAAAPLLGLVHALAGAPGATGKTTRLGAVGYGGGRATAVAVEVRRTVPGARPVEDLGVGTEVSYTDALKARGQLEAMGDPIPMGVPPGGAAFVRGNVEMLGLLGARCRACATISTPPSIHPTCIACGGADLQTVELARRGRVQTFVVNQTMPPPFQAPLPLVVVDLDDGARLMVQGVPADAPTLAVGDTVELSLRRYAVERGIPVYGYKALRRAQSASGGPDTAGARPVEEGAR